MPILTIPSYDQWMTDTKLGPMHPRSSQLKAVDVAIQNYERAKTQENLFQIKFAFEEWKRYKGVAWKTSDRNPKPKEPLTALDKALASVDPARYRLAHFSPQELMALSELAKQRKQVITALFTGKKVTFRASPKALVSAVRDGAREAADKCTAAKTWLQGNHKKIPAGTGDALRRKMEDMVKAMFSVQSLESLGSLFGFISPIIAEACASAAPVLGYVKDGYDLFVGWTKVAIALHDQHSIGECGYIIDTGAPAAAFAGLKTCLANETKKEAGAATLATTSFALKTGLVFADGGAISGPVVGAANALASLSLSLYWLATEWRATRAINRALSRGELDVRLFKTYPLMGCYLLTSATFSDLIPIDCFGMPGWTDYIGKLKQRRFDGIYDAATGLIDKSPWEIQGMPKRPIKGGFHGGVFAPLGDLASNIKDVFS